MTELKKIIVIGASAGGYHAMADLVKNIPIDLDVAVFAVLHMSKNSAADIVLHHLQKNTGLICEIAKDGTKIIGGHLYLAPADHHLMIKGEIIRIHNGPKENRWRPSIDVLFRSAAASYDSRVIGIILSGLLDDGTSGMSAIKRSGGICIVQEPDEAAYPDMPMSVLSSVDVDYRVSLSDMGYIIEDSLSKLQTPIEIPEDVLIEADITEKMISNIEDLQKIGEQTKLTCPDCGGGLWKIGKNKIYRYRCYTGHVYTEGILSEKQSEGLEESLWIAIRMLEERRNLLNITAGHEKDAGREKESLQNNSKAKEVEIHIERLKAVLYGMDKPESATI